MKRSNFKAFTGKYVEYTDLVLAAVNKIPRRLRRKTLTATNSCLSALIRKDASKPEFLEYVSTILFALKQVPLEYWDGVFYLIQEYERHLGKRDNASRQKKR